MRYLHVSTFEFLRMQKADVQDRQNFKRIYNK
jgi:hypothetical protein